MARRKKSRGRTTPRGTTSTAPQHVHGPGCDHDHDDHGHEGHGHEGHGHDDHGHVHHDGHGQLPTDRSPARLLLDDAAHVVAEYGSDKLDELEVWASAIQTVFRPRGLPPRPIERPKPVLQAAKRDGGTPGAVVASAIAVYGPSRVRPKAEVVARDLRGAGVEVPDWVGELGRVEPLAAALVTDVWNDGCSVMVDFRRPDGEVRGVGVSIVPYGGITAADFTYGATIAEATEAAEGDELTRVDPVDVADARALVERALANRDRHPDLFEDSDGTVDIRSLVEQRFALLPAGGTPPIPVERVDVNEREIVDRFLARFDVDELEGADDAIDAICRFARFCDGDPLVWSPHRVEAFLEGWLLERLEVGDPLLEEIADVLVAWVTFAGAEKDLPADAVEVTVQVIGETRDRLARMAAEEEAAAAAWEDDADVDGSAPSKPGLTLPGL